MHVPCVVAVLQKDKVAMDLGFYYMANAMGRLIGVLLGGFLYYYTVSRRTFGPEFLSVGLLFCASRSLV